MRLEDFNIVTDHALFQDTGAEDHHVTAVTFRVLINSLSIAPGPHNLIISLGKSGCRTVQGIIRGNQSVDVQGHTGVWFLGGASTANSSSVGIRPYPGGVSSYIGGYSRFHGDSHLSHSSQFGTRIALDDVYISGTNVVFVFNNTEVVLYRNLTVYGVGICK